MRMRGGVLVDVNQPWAKLHAKAKADNRAAALAAYEALQRYPDDREAAAAYVHRAWIRRNRGDKNQPRALFKPYAQLSEVEKDKDRAHIDNMKRAIARSAEALAQARSGPQGGEAEATARTRRRRAAGPQPERRRPAPHRDRAEEALAIARPPGVRRSCRVGWRGSRRDAEQGDGRPRKDQTPLSNRRDRLPHGPCAQASLCARCAPP
jgi:hypothetical protein